MIKSSSLYLPSTRPSRFCFTDRDSQLSSFPLIGFKEAFKINTSCYWSYSSFNFLWPWKNYCLRDIWLLITFALLFVVHQSVLFLLFSYFKNFEGKLRCFKRSVGLCYFCIGRFYIFKTKSACKNKYFQFPERIPTFLARNHDLQLAANS